MARNRSFDEQCIKVVMDATDCTRIRAETAMNQLGFVPDAIAKVEADMKREREREEQRRRLSPVDMAERIDSLEEQLAALWDYVYKLEVKP